MVVYNIGRTDVAISHGGETYVIERGGYLDLPDEVARLYLNLIPGLSRRKPQRITEVQKQDLSIAEVVPQDTTEAEVVSGESPGEGEDAELDSMSKRELLAYARERGYKVDGRRSKTDIVAAIKEQMG